MNLEITPREAKMIREGLFFAWIQGAWIIGPNGVSPEDYRDMLNKLAPQLYRIERGR